MDIIIKQGRNIATPLPTLLRFTSVDMKGLLLIVLIIHTQIIRSNI